MGTSFRFDRPDERLKRDIGLLGASFLVLNGLIGAGIFALPAVLAEEMGAFSPWLFPLFGLLMLSVVLAFGELASYFRASGGPVLYTAEAFGPVVAFQTGWLYYLSRLTAVAANVNILILYASSLWPAIAEGPPRVAALVLICAALTIVNVVGVKRAVRALDGLTFLKVVPLLGMVVYGLFVAHDEVRWSGKLPELSAVEGTALLVMYAFIGFENPLVPAGETANPRRTLPRSLIVTVIATAALYFLIQLSYVAVVGERAVEGPPLVEFGRVLAGPAGAMLITLAAVFSVAGNLTGSMVASPRMTFALAREGALPAWFAHVSERFRTPDNSIIFLGALACLLAVTGSFVWLAVASTLARLLVYIASIAALPKIRRLAGVGPPTGAGAILVRYGVPAIGLGVCIFAIAQSTFESWRLLVVLVALGGVLYLAEQWLGRSTQCQERDRPADRD